mmetsp:Transcript_22290/g.46833  ORF Transcript_22290/g.46833 Transcript_22290/m.46833 type:complete len:209 (-) Transcript_22290:449-1075(-)
MTVRIRRRERRGTHILSSGIDVTRGTSPHGSDGDAEFGSEVDRSGRRREGGHGFAGGEDDEVGGDVSADEGSPSDAQGADGGGGAPSGSALGCTAGIQSRHNESGADATGYQKANFGHGQKYQSLGSLEQFQGYSAIGGVHRFQSGGGRRRRKGRGLGVILSCRKFGTHSAHIHQSVSRCADAGTQRRGERVGEDFLYARRVFVDFGR